VGLLLTLLVQPSPLTFAEGWSTSHGIDHVRLGRAHQAAVDGENRIHLVWLKQVDRKLAAFYGQLDRHGQLLGQAVRLSSPDANAENVALALTGEEAPLVLWLEKGDPGEPQRLMMAQPTTGTSPRELSLSPKIMRDLAVTGDHEGHTFAVWSDNRQGMYDLYVTVLDAQSNPVVNERRITDSGQDLVFEPAVAAGDGVVHVVYFYDATTDQLLVHQAVDPSGEPLTPPLVLERVSQVATDLGSGQQQTYPLLAVAEPGGTLWLYESLGGTVRQRKIDRDGQVTLPPEPLLSSRHISQVNLARQGGQRWLVWAGLDASGSDRFQVYAAPLDEAGQVGKQTRISFATTSALWPVMVLDGDGGQHVIWQQNAGPYAYQLMYVNNLDPARISLWQRLGFPGIGGQWTLVFAIAESTLLALITAFLRIWRAAIAGGVTTLAVFLLRRSKRFKVYASATAWVVLLAALLIVARPEAKTLGHMPVFVTPAAHWVMALAATALTLYLGYVWRGVFYSILIWAGLAGVWMWAYYFLNITLILREGFAI
jgi:hypothetical protein